jgi:hypothetical protein
MPLPDLIVDHRLMFNLSVSPTVREEERQRIGFHQGSYRAQDELDLSYDKITVS